MFEYFFSSHRDFKEDIYNIPDFSLITQLHIHTIGHTFPDENYTNTRKKSKTSAIEYVISGTGTLHVDDKTYIVSPGDSYLLPQGHSHYYYSNFSNPMEKLWINCLDDFFPALSDLFHLSNTVVYKNTNTMPIITKIHSICRNGGDLYEMQQNIEVLLFKLAQLLKKSKQEYESNLQTPISIIKFYIDNHITENFSLDELAKISNYNKDYLIRLFKKTYGLTPYRYILNKKIELICSLLSSTHMTSAQIASHVGFCDEKNMAKLFKNKMHTTISEYKRKIDL